LRGMRRLRGTPFDVFGWDRDRRAERALIAEYERLIGEAVGTLPYETLLSVAESVMSIKGYGPVKEAAMTAWRSRTAELLERAPVTAGTGARRGAARDGERRVTGSGA